MVLVVSASVVVAELSLLDVDGVASVDVLATFDGVVESASVLLFLLVFVNWAVVTENIEAISDLEVLSSKYFLSSTMYRAAART